MRLTRAAILVVVLSCCATAAARVLTKKTTRRERTLSTGLVLSRHGNNIVGVYETHSSLFGNGASVQKAKLRNSTFPLHGVATTTSYYGDGAAVTKSKFTIGTPNKAGIGAITGSGKCTGGTGIHKHERCKFKLKGTYNSKTMLSRVVAVGKATT
jgi:hypothetical protein